MEQKIKFELSKFITEFCAFGHRQLEQETQAANYIRSLLQNHNIQLKEQKFSTEIPLFKTATLTADGESIPAIATCFVSGKISGKDNIISSLISSQRFIDDPNINFNPSCKGISRSNHYFAPSVAVAPKDIAKICAAKEVEGIVEVEQHTHESINFLVGNINNPQSILLGHYDSVGPGATDNAAGTAVLLKLIIDHPTLLEKNLFVIAGNEELSYDYPIYWGHGYRAFEEIFSSQLDQAKKILVVDCVGNGPTTISQDPHLVHIGFPIKKSAALKEKISMIYGNFEKLMEVYQSDLDTAENVTEEHMQDATNKILSLVQ